MFIGNHWARIKSDFPKEVAEFIEDDFWQEEFFEQFNFELHWERDSPEIYFEFELYDDFIMARIHADGTYTLWNKDYEFDVAMDIEKPGHVNWLGFILKGMGHWTRG